MPDIERNTIGIQNKANKSQQHEMTHTQKRNIIAAPDGGTRAWLVMLGSFFCNGILFGVINTYGVFYTEIVSNLTKAGVSQASSKAALVGSLAIGTTFAISPLSGILTDKVGIRRTTLIGGAVATIGMFCSSFLTNIVEALFFTFGFMFGLGGSLAYTPSLVILTHYFHKYLGIVNGIVTAGSSVFTIVMPFVLEALLKSWSFQGTLWVLTGLSSCIMLCALLFKPLPTKFKPKQTQSTIKGFINVSIWKNKRYLIWVTVIPLSLLGYFVVYVHIQEYVKITFPESDRKLPVVCIAITSLVGRLVFGYIADFPQVDRIFLHQISFLILGIATMCVPFCTSYTWLLVISLVIGISDGGYIALLGPIAFDICGEDGASQAIGFLLGFCSIPMTFGPPIAGMIYDRTGSYQLPMILAGIPPILGFVAMFLIRCVKMPPPVEHSRELLAQPEIIRQPQVNSIQEKMDQTREPLTQLEGRISPTQIVNRTPKKHAKLASAESSDNE